MPMLPSFFGRWSFEKTQKNSPNRSKEAMDGLVGKFPVRILRCTTKTDISSPRPVSWMHGRKTLTVWNCSTIPRCFIAAGLIPQPYRRVFTGTKCAATVRTDMVEVVISSKSLAIVNHILKDIGYGKREAGILNKPISIRYPAIDTNTRRITR